MCKIYGKFPGTKAKFDTNLDQPPFLFKLAAPGFVMDRLAYMIATNQGYCLPTILPGCRMPTWVG